MKKTAWSVIAGLCTLMLLSGCALFRGPSQDAHARLLPPPPALRMEPVPGGLGVNIHFYDGSANDWKFIDQAGIGIVRMDVSWAHAEKEPGHYDFSSYDRLISALGQRHMRVLFILDYGNPLYDKGLAPHTDAGRTASAKFCAALAARYADKPVIWELWNEPNGGFWKPKRNLDDYVAWCKAVVPAIRAANPKACIIGPGTSGIDLNFLQGCFERGYLNLVDGVSVHPYRSHERGPETAGKEYATLAAMIKQYRSPKNRRSIPIISSEWGYSCVYVSPELQGKYLARQWLFNMMSGVPISIWYDWHNDGTNPKNGEHNFGTVTYNYQPKPAYLAMKTLISELRGYRVVGRIPVGSEADYVVAFRSDQRYKLAVWTTRAAHAIDLGRDVTISRVTDLLGGNPAPPRDGQILVNDAPRYLTLSGRVPARFKRGVGRSISACNP